MKKIGMIMILLLLALASAQENTTTTIIERRTVSDPGVVENRLLLEHIISEVTVLQERVERTATREEVEGLAGKINEANTNMTIAADSAKNAVEWEMRSAKMLIVVAIFIMFIGELIIQTWFSKERHIEVYSEERAKAKGLIPDEPDAPIEIHPKQPGPGLVDYLKKGAKEVQKKTKKRAEERKPKGGDIDAATRKD